MKFLLHAHSNHSHSASNAERERKALKAGNKNGDPIAMKSKILAAVSDPFSPSTAIVIAESAGFVRRIDLAVSIRRFQYYI